VSKPNMFGEAARRCFAIGDRLYTEAFNTEYLKHAPAGEYNEYANDRAWEAGTRAAEPFDRQARAYWRAADAVCV
jgi:hypothetical protein